MKYLVFRFVVFVILAWILPYFLLAIPAYFFVFDILIDRFIFEILYDMKKLPYGTEVFWVKL